MNRTQALEKAQVLRRGKMVQDCSTTRFKEHDSISLAKKSTRGKRCVALRDNETFRPERPVEE